FPVRVEVVNESPCLWPTSVHLSYHWWSLLPANPTVYEGKRGFMPDALRPGERVTIPVQLLAPPVSGPYRLEYDLVHESVAWFSDKGASTSSVPVEVIPTKLKGDPS